MSGASRGWALVLALSMLAPAARAGDETKRFAEGLEARVWSPWPATTQRGWAPIFVELIGDESERRVEIEARCGDSIDRRVRTAVRLAPGESAALELLVPMGGLYNDQYQVEMRCDEGETYFNGVVGSSTLDPAFRQVLFFSEREPAPGAVERWSSALSTTAIGERRTYAMGPAGVLTSTASTGPTPNDVDVARAPFAALSAHHGAYSSLDLVVLDADENLPGEAQLDPLVAWVRTGGDLLVLGERAGEAALGVPALAAWMEPRFETEGRAGSEYRCGLGRLFIGHEAGDLEHGYTEWVRDILGADASLTPKNGAWRGATVTPAVPGLQRLPYRSFAALLILFALVIGPLNFLVVRRSKKPVLLLLSIPAIALVATLTLLVYGILFQGIELKSASASTAVLDQRTHRSACVEARQFFAGLAPAAGLALGPGTIVHAKQPDGSRGWYRQRFEVELADGTLLTGDYLPSRRATDQVLAVERAERARLDVRRSGESLLVDNNLGVTVEELFVRDPEGRLHRRADPIAPGERAELAAVDRSELPEVVLSHMLGDVLSPTPVSLGYPDLIPPGCYLARLERSPFRDDCGLEASELAGAHVVLGVLPLDPEAWR